MILGAKVREAVEFFILDTGDMEPVDTSLGVLFKAKEWWRGRIKAIVEIRE